MWLCDFKVQDLITKPCYFSPNKTYNFPDFPRMKFPYQICLLNSFYPSTSLFFKASVYTISTKKLSWNFNLISLLPTYCNHNTLFCFWNSTHCCLLYMLGLFISVCLSNKILDFWVAGTMFLSFSFNRPSLSS